MVKKLLHYVVRADELSWPEFASENCYYVLVIIPQKEGEASPSETHEALFEIMERPDISGDYRVAVLRKRTGAPSQDCCLSVGRAPTNDVVLVDIEVSKVHAFFEIDQDRNWSIRDAGSTNGTFVNGLRIPSDRKTSIQSMDTLKFGIGLNAAFFSPEDFYRFLCSRNVRTGVLGS